MIEELTRGRIRHATALYVVTRARDYDAIKKAVIGYGTLYMSDVVDDVALLWVVFPGPDRTAQEVGALLSNHIAKAYPFVVGKDATFACEQLRTLAGRWPK